MQDFPIRLGNYEKSVNLFPEKLQVPCTYLNLKPGNPVNFLFGKYKLNTTKESVILTSKRAVILTTRVLFGFLK